MTAPAAADLADLEALADARRRIVGVIDLLGRDELEALELCAHGLVRGRDVYGELRVATDVRDLRAEALEELRDAMIYSAAGLMRLTRGSR